tara:strand:+ start:3156 stop:4151 length:996 start_codon:yes stop_codon:yes gene_type:complete
MEWANPEWFWALLLLPIIIGFYIYSYFGKKKTTFTFSTLNSAEKLPGNWKVHLHWLTALLSWAAFSLLVVALARPQLTLTTVEKNAEGIDIVMVLDISSSMRAEDLKPNRFEAARDVAKAFVDKRASDRIGLVTFAMKSFTVVPPTLDYNLLNNLLDELKMGIIEDGTAIGMGIATAINRLKDSDTKSKIIILLTDGQNNAGEIDPVTAADLAVTYGIKIYTIGAGTRGTAPYPIQDPIFGLRHQNIEVNIDEEMLSSVAKLTGGKYYRATDTNELYKVYEEIDSLEKTKVEELIYTDYEDEYPIYLGLSFAFFLAALVINRFYLRSIVNS